ncbi:lipopolysaccharide biosynthesis protein [Puniceicoccaceae bacterium K14]|nr:lipopolysaccharide biosynthesis protein [Puniceicoccaceae bacterium K14]
MDIKDLKRKSVRGGVVTLVSQGLTIAIQLASTVFLARLLSPYDYGLLAMITSVTAFAGLFRDLGLSSAAIQKSDLTDDQQVKLFWFNIALGLAITLLVAASAPIVSFFFKEPRLTSATIALSFTFLLGSIGSQSSASLSRSFKFARKSIASILGAFVTLVVALTMALNGFEYWSLVWGNLAGAATTTILLCMLSEFRPKIRIKKTETSSLIRFGAHITAFDLVNYFHRNLDNLLIGRLHGSIELGLYSRAYSLLLLPLGAIRSPLMSVAYPVMSTLQKEPVLFRSYYRRTTLLLALLGMPLTAFLFCSSETVIMLLLGAKWKHVSDIFSVLAITGFVQPTLSLIGLVLMSLGATKKYLMFGVANAICVSIGFCIGVRFGAMGVAISYAISIYTTSVPFLIIFLKGTPVSLGDYVRSIAFPAMAAIIAIIPTYGVSVFLQSSSNLLLVLVKGVVYFLSFITVVWLVPNLRAELKEIPAYFRKN